MERKKGIELNQAFGAVLTLVLVAVLVIIAIVVFASLSTSFEGSSDLSLVNDTVDMSAGANSVNNATFCGFGDFSISQVWNGTSGVAIDAGNYTTTRAGLITNTTSDFPSDWWVIWTGTWGSEACTASESSITEFSNYTSLIGLVGTIIFLGLVIGVLVASFVLGRRREV